jgi:hypothetical protein
MIEFPLKSYKLLENGARVPNCLRRWGPLQGKARTGRIISEEGGLSASGRSRLRIGPSRAGTAGFAEMVRRRRAFTFWGGVVPRLGVAPSPKGEPAMINRRGRPLAVGLVLLGSTLAAWALARPAAAADPKVSTPNRSVKGAPREVMDLRVTPLKVRANVAGCMFWENNRGKACWMLDPAGTARRVSFPDFKETHVIELGRKCSWLSPSAEGLVVSVAELQEVWLLDPKRFTVKRRIAVPGLQRAVSARSLSTAFASNGRELFEIDLKKGKAARYSGEKPQLPGYADPVVSPDGKYLFTSGGLEQMHRFNIRDDKARFEQSSPRIAQGRVDVGIQVSPDSKFVTLPSYAGNYGAGRYGNLFVYPVQNIERPEVTLEFEGPSAMAVSADPASGKFYAGGLLVFDKDGKREKEYKLDAGEVKQMLVHPRGGKLLLLGTDKFLLVELPAK